MGHSSVISYHDTTAAYNLHLLSIIGPGCVHQYIAAALCEMSVAR